MELVEGESLAARLARGPLPVQDVLRLCRQVAGALERAHRAGIIHRDLKPGNVMLAKDGAKLMDFGLARSTAISGGAGDGADGSLTQSPTMVQPLTSEGALLGTFQYMAPEQLEGKEADAGRGGAVKETASFRHWPGGLSWRADGEEIWAAEWGCPEGTVLWGMTPAGGRRTVSRFPGMVLLHDLSPGGDALISQSLSTFASALFGPGSDRERDLTWMDMGFVKDISDDGLTVLMDEQGAGVASDPQVFLRPADGSPPVHLGPGLARSLSPDGRWVIVAGESGLTLLPAGTGEPGALPLPGLSLGMSAAWFPDGERVLVAGNLEGEPSRLFVATARGGGLRAVTPPGVGFPPGLSPKPVSPDGSKVFGLAGLSQLRIHAVESGEELAACPLEEDEEPIRWHEDGRTIFTWRRGEVPARISRLDVETGRREPWRKLEISDPTGAFSTRFVVMTPDGQTCACTYLRMLSQLHMVRGLR
jgi:hypothetical protein